MTDENKSFKTGSLPPKFAQYRNEEVFSAEFYRTVHAIATDEGYPLTTKYTPENKETIWSVNAIPVGITHGIVDNYTDYFLVIPK